MFFEDNKKYVELDNKKFGEYISTLEEHWQMNRIILLNHNHPFICCDRLLSLRSQYFHSLFSNNYLTNRTMELTLDCQPGTFQIFLAYLHTNILVLPQGSLPNAMIQLSHLA